MSRRILRVGPIKPSLATTLAERYDALVLPDDDTRAAFLSEHGASIGAVVTSGRSGVGADLIARLPALGAIVNFGVGYAPGERHRRDARRHGAAHPRQPRQLAR